MRKVNVSIKGIRNIGILRVKGQDIVIVIFVGTVENIILRLILTQIF